MKGKTSKAVITPWGKFNSLTEAAQAGNIKIQTLSARIRKYKMDGYCYG